jgi:hypothetical protein
MPSTFIEPGPDGVLSGKAMPDACNDAAMISAFSKISPYSMSGMELQGG